MPNTTFYLSTVVSFWFPLGTGMNWQNRHLLLPRFLSDCKSPKAFLVAAFVVFLLVRADSLSAQASKRALPETHPDPVEALVHSAGGLQIEYRADIQLKAIEGGKLSNKKLVTETLLQLFDSASLAKFPYKMSIVYAGDEPHEGEIVNALQYLNLDTLSIRTRVVRHLLSVDRDEALQLLQAISLEIPPTACGSILVPQVSDYYSTLTALGNQELSYGQRSRERYLKWVGEQIRGMSSANQLNPMAGALLSLHTSVNEFQQLADAYSLRLGEMRATDREMAILQSEGSLASAIRQLATRLQEKSWPVAPLIGSYKSFLEKSANEQRCSDPPSTWRPADWNKITRDYIQMSHQFGLDSQGHADFVSTRRSADKGGAAEMEILPDPGELFNGLEKLQQLRKSQHSSAEPLGGKEAMGWESDLANTLSKIDALDPSRAPCYVCTFSEKASLLLLYLDFTPPGEWKEKVLSRLIQLLANQTAEHDAPIDWLTRMDAVLNMSRKPSSEEVQKLNELERTGKAPNLLPSALGPRTLQLMKESGNRTMYVYATADEVLEIKFIIPPHPD
jgi:hypothetical protein